jgi:hypothetical protein
MKNKKAHILSLILIILMIFFTVATSKVDYVVIRNKITYEFDNEYLLIKIETDDDPNYYKLEHDCVDIMFEGSDVSQSFLNIINEDGENLSEYLINYPYPIKSTRVAFNDYVFEIFVENKYFIIKIKKELLINKHDNIKLGYIVLINGNENSKRKYEKERYYD